MGLEKLLSGRFGSMPQIDMDKQIARVRVLRPVLLDIPGLAEGVVRNNLGVDRLLVRVAAEVRGESVTIPATGQSFQLKQGGLAAAPGDRPVVLSFAGWESELTLRTELIDALPD